MCRHEWALSPLYPLMSPERGQGRKDGEIKDRRFGMACCSEAKVENTFNKIHSCPAMTK